MNRLQRLLNAEKHGTPPASGKPAGGHMFRLFLTAFTAAIVAISAIAQEPVPARFLIERIEVRNASRVSEDLVIAETLLRAGTEYSEAELGAASARLSRLPFLV